MVLIRQMRSDFTICAETSSSGSQTFVLRDTTRNLDKLIRWVRQVDIYTWYVDGIGWLLVPRVKFMSRMSRGSEVHLLDSELFVNIFKGGSWQGF